MTAIIMRSFEIVYVRGDATAPACEEGCQHMIVHICNNIGGWGAGFAIALSNRWPYPELCYRHLAATARDSGRKLEFGALQLVRVEDDLCVANLIGQDNFDPVGPPIRYDAVHMGLRRVQRIVLRNYATVHMPRIGCGLAGGTWDKIEPLIIEELTRFGISVRVYDV